MATTRKDGVLMLTAYFRDKRVTRLIERAAELDGRSASAFIAHVSEQAARKIVAKHEEERKSLAAERQLA